MKPCEGPGHLGGGRMEAKRLQNCARWRPQASQMEQKRSPNRLEFELRDRSVAEFPFRLVSLARGIVILGSFWDRFDIIWGHLGIVLGPFWG